MDEFKNDPGLLKVVLADAQGYISFQAVAQMVPKISPFLCKDLGKLDNY